MTWKRLVPPLLACLTLGLAPFVPEPHIVGKLRWVLGGADSMAVADWFDLVFHGWPWVWLGVAIVRGLSGRGAAGNARWGAWLLLLAFVGMVVCVLWAIWTGRL